MIFTDISPGRRHIEFLSKSFGRFKIIRNSVFQSSIKKTQIFVLSLSCDLVNMGANSDQNCTLYVRHLPSDLTNNEKEDLLLHFGATSVKVMGNRGPMVNPSIK